MAQVSENTNCFSFDAFKRVTEGIPIIENMPNVRNDGTVYPPHVWCGKYIPIDKVKVPQTKVIGGQRFLTNSRLRLIEPQNSKAFNTFANVGRSGVFLLVNLLTTNQRVTDKTSWLRAWEGIMTEDGVETLLTSDTGGLFFFTEDGQEIDVYMSNGVVCRLRRQNGAIDNIPLTRKEMAQVRVEQFKSQIELLDGSDGEIRRLHGVLGGAVRLLSFVQNDSGPREIISEFLSENLTHMTDSMRRLIRTLLVRVNDTYADMFIEDHDFTVVNLNARRSANSPKRAEINRKKAERSAYDAAARLAARGDSTAHKQAKGK